MTPLYLTKTDGDGNVLLHAALAYARRGWPVFSCHTPRFSGGACGPTKGRCPQLGSSGHTPFHVSCSCKAGKVCHNFGNHPRTPHGLKDAATDEASVRQWWAKWPDANIGLITGSVSGLVVLGIDPRHGGDVILEVLEAEHNRLSQTVESLTGVGGRHLLFQHASGNVRSGTSRLGPGLDIKAEGGYIIAPPSLHASGRRYEMEAFSHPDDLPLAPLPAWLAALEQGRTLRLNNQPAEADGRILKGQRNITLTSLAGTMRRCGMSEVTILAALLEENQRRCDPPLSPDEVQRIAASVGRYAPATITRRTETCEEDARCPPLPDDARVDEELAAEASPWLDDYIAWSRTPGAHRIRPRPLYLALHGADLAHDPLHQEQAADLAIELLRRAELGMLRADDDATPQAFPRAMTAHVPENCDEFSAEAKAALCQQLAFAAQRGWFYEEFGQHLAAMMQREGVMAAFRSILRRFDD